MNQDNLEYLILEKIAQLNTPVGASFLCSQIHASQASIGRELHNLEQRGLLEKVSNKGRILTEEGRRRYLEEVARLRACLNDAEEEAP